GRGRRGAPPPPPPRGPEGRAPPRAVGAGRRQAWGARRAARRARCRRRRVARGDARRASRSGWRRGGHEPPDAAGPSALREPAPRRMSPVLAAAAGVVRRDLLLAMRRRAEALAPVLLFVVAGSLFPLGIGPEPDLLRRIAPGVLWVGALLATLLGLGRLFAADHDDGTLEQMALSPEPFAVLVLAKVAAHWLVAGLPLVAAAPVLALQYGLPADTIAVLAASLVLGTPVLSLVGAIGAALTLGV